MPKLYDNVDSGNCYKVRLLLAHLGMAHERVHVEVLGDRNCAARQELRALNPIGRIPTLVLDDGEVLGESNAILCRLADGTPLYPADPATRSRILSWMFFEQNNHEPNIAARRFWIAVQKEPEARRDVLQHWLDGGHAALSVMEGHLGRHPWFGAEAMSIADLALYAYTHEAEDGGFDLAPYPAVRAWLERVRTQPGHVGAHD